MIRRTFMQAIGLGLFSPTVFANYSKVVKYLDKNLIVISEIEMEEIRTKAELLFIPRYKISEHSDLLSEMKLFVDISKQFNVSIETNVYGNLNNHGAAIISYDESNKLKHPREYLSKYSVQLPSFQTKAPQTQQEAQ